MQKILGLVRMSTKLFQRPGLRNTIPQSPHPHPGRCRHDSKVHPGIARCVVGIHPGQKRQPVTMHLQEIRRNVSGL